MTAAVAVSAVSVALAVVPAASVSAADAGPGVPMAPVFDLSVIANVAAAQAQAGAGTEGPAADSALDSVGRSGLAVAPDGSVVLSTFTRLLRLVRQADGSYDLTRIAGDGTQAPTAPASGAVALGTAFPDFGALAYGPDGRLYVAVGNAVGVVYRLEPNGTVTAVAGHAPTTADSDPGPYPGGPGSVSLPQVGGLVFDGTDLLILANNRILRVTDPGEASATVTRIAGTETGDANSATPTDALTAGISASAGAIGRDGALYFSDARTGSIVRLADGMSAIYAGGGGGELSTTPQPATDVRLGTSNALTAGSGGVLYVGVFPDVVAVVPGDTPTVQRVAGTGAFGTGSMTDGPALASTTDEARALAYDVTRGLLYVGSVFVSGAGSDSVARSQVAVLTARAPAVPGKPSVVAGVGSATVTVTPGSGGAVAATSYTVTASPGGATCTVPATADPLACTVSGLPGGRSYTFTVTASGGGATTVSSVASDPVLVPALVADGDGDGLSDAVEEELGTDPARRDTDRDGLGDGAEVNGIRVAARVFVGPGEDESGIRIGVVRTNPLRADTDGDGIRDRKELRGTVIRQTVVTRDGRYVIGRRVTDPTRADTDRDGLSDRVEIRGSANTRFDREPTDPARADTDKSGMKDGREIEKGFNPNRF